MNFSKQNVLIVEDDIETLEIMTEVFEPIFFKVYQAKDGYEAIENFQKNKIDVILCDIITPPINNLNYGIMEYGKNRCKKIITKRVV